MTHFAGKTAVVTGAAGFIGSHLTDRLLAAGATVIALDDLSSGNLSHLDGAFVFERFKFALLDVAEPGVFLRFLKSAGRVDTIWHLAANSNIQAGTADPFIDLRKTFLSTFYVLQAAIEHGVPEFVFASSSAVYGEHQEPLTEDSGPLEPVSAYGAMKLASEAVISAARERLQHAWIARFPNVVGSRSTHGVIFDLIWKLRGHPPALQVLGDGNQEKPYLHVSELIDALLFIVSKSRERFNCFNIGPAGGTTTVRTIAEAVAEAVSPGIEIRYAQERRGWIGDVPRFSYSTKKLDRLGWQAKLSSDKSVRRAIRELV